MESAQVVREAAQSEGGVLSLRENGITLQREGAALLLALRDWLCVVDPQHGAALLACAPRYAPHYDPSSDTERRRCVEAYSGLACIVYHHTRWRVACEGTLVVAGRRVAIADVFWPVYRRAYGDPDALDCQLAYAFDLRLIAYRIVQRHEHDDLVCYAAYDSEMQPHDLPIQFKQPREFSFTLRSLARSLCARMHAC
jgi:hypothetical protein